MAFTETSYVLGSLQTMSYVEWVFEARMLGSKSSAKKIRFFILEGYLNTIPHWFCQGLLHSLRNCTKGRR